MNDAFIYGYAVEGENFTDRENETKRLKANFEHGVNTLLISNRRIGKTSLVRHVGRQVNPKKATVVYLDIFDCRSEYDFYNKLATAVLQQTSSKIDTILQNAKNFLSRVSPKISMGPDPTSEFSLSLGITPKEYAPEQILELAENIAKKQKKRIVVCIDEFQQIGEFPDSISVQKRLRGAWQLQQNVSYCLFGSKKHLMENIFNDKSKPFYKFGDMMFIKKIPTDEWVQFICAQFRETGKSITAKQAAKICELTENLSSYVQHLAWIVWYKADKTVTDNDITSAIDDLLEQNKVFFQREVEQLSELQLNFLHALAKGVSSGFSRKEVIKKYRLESSANVQSIKRSLLKKDLIDVDDQEISFNDSLFKLWLKRQTFYE